MFRLTMTIFLLSSAATIAQVPENDYTPQSSEPTHLVAFKDQLYFVADDGHRGRELWRMDPRSKESTLIADISSGETSSKIDSLHASEDTLWFRVLDSRQRGELWSTNGEPGAGTGPVWRPKPEDWNGVSMILAEVAGGLIFTTGGKGEAQNYWVCAREGLKCVRLEAPAGDTLSTDVISYGMHQGALFFGAESLHSGTPGLWRTDGTPAGTWLIQEFKNFPNPVISLGEAGLLVVGETEELGIELWITGDQPGTTRLVRDIYPGSESSRPADFRLGHATPPGQPPCVYFAATHPETGRELWRSNGTEEGTVLAQDIVPGKDSSNPYRLETSPLSIFLIASTPETGKELWCAFTNPDNLSYTPLGLAGEGLVGPADSEPYAMVVGPDGGLFYAQKGPDGEEPWHATSTPGSARQLLDIHPFESSEPFWPVRVGGSLFFTAEDPVHGREIWTSFGKSSPPELVADIKKDDSVNPSSSPADLTGLGDKLLFTANDIIHGNELWVSDGREAGTVMLKDIAVGRPSSNPTQITVVGGLAYFRAETLNQGAELWVTDGTPDGTFLVADLIPGPESSYPDHLIAFGENLIFMARQPEVGNELTILRPGKQPSMVRYIRDGPNSTHARNFFLWNGVVYFLADDGLHGEELWRTDGTHSGTYMVKDIVAAPFEPLSVSAAFPAGDHLFLSGTTASKGHELWIWENFAEAPRLVRDISPSGLLDTRAEE